MKRHNVTYENKYNDLPINTNKDKGLGCFCSFLCRYREKFEHMIKKHSKVMQVRFDLRYPGDDSVSHDKTHISTLCEYLKRWFVRNQTGPHSADIQIEWVIDQKKSSSHPHYHVIVLVNGNAFQYAYTVLKKAEYYWGIILKTSHGGLVDHCDKYRNSNGRSNGMMWRRGSSDAKAILEDMHYQASYLAKARDKDGLSKGAWPRGGSRNPSK